MVKVLFVCHGNICRSPMAEYMFKDLVKKEGLEDKFIIESAATSTEEIGNPVHYGTLNILKRLGINPKDKRACQIDFEMYKNYDYIIIMDKYNHYNIVNRLGHMYENKIKLLLEYASIHRDISDPWYTGDFEATYEDIKIGLDGFLNYLKSNDLIGE